MIRNLLVAGCLLGSVAVQAADEKKPVYPAFDNEVARAHELKPHRRSIPVDGVSNGDIGIRLKLIVSATGEVMKAKPEAEQQILKFWPRVEGEVSQWRFTPFEKDGRAVAAQVEEYIDLVPPERLPKVYMAAPEVRPNSKVTVTLERSGCYGTCPAYTVAVGTDGIVFKGQMFVVATGRHTDKIDAGEARELAKQFVAADFYSMDARYEAPVTDCPMFTLTVEIDGKRKEVVDYVGAWEGMPEVVTELEETVDQVARTDRWVKGSEGLVAALQAENYEFKSYAGQMALKQASMQGKTATVGELLAAGVPLSAMAAPKGDGVQTFEGVAAKGWLAAAAEHPEALRLLIGAKASKEDQKDKDLALAEAAGWGRIDGVRALIAYGANPNADMSKWIVMPEGGMTEGQGPGSVLIEAARSGNPEVVREILKYKPKLEVRGDAGQTAIFLPGSSQPSREEEGGDGSTRAECARLLADAGADVNANDENGNTPLHESQSTEVAKELLAYGANVNARNEAGETPIFTTYDVEAVALLVEHGADLTVRNDKGETVLEAVGSKGPAMRDALLKAIAEWKEHEAGR